jgi:hypothetical protein
MWFANTSLVLNSDCGRLNACYGEPSGPHLVSKRAPFQGGFAISATFAGHMAWGSQEIKPQRYARDCLLPHSLPVCQRVGKGCVEGGRASAAKAATSA